MTREKITSGFILLLFSLSLHAQVTSRIDTLPSGEIMLVQEILLDAPAARVWQAYTTEADWRQWVSPVVEINMGINGTIRSHYDANATIGDPGTIVIHILNYIPGRMITMQAELTGNFPDFIKEDEKNLYSIVCFEPTPAGKTRLTMYGAGYRNEDRWNELLSFFIQGNEMTLIKLKEFVERDQ